MWLSEDGQTTKSELSDGRKVKFLLSVVEFGYDLFRTDDHMGNVG